MMRQVRGILVGLVLASAAWGQDAVSPQEQAAEIQALKARVEELEKRLDALARQQEAGTRPAVAESSEPAPERAADTAAPDAPSVALSDGGLRFTSPDGAFETRIGLRLMHDFAWFQQERELQRLIGDEQDGTGFRSARLTLRGRLFTDITYLAEIEFAGQDGADSPSFEDVWMQYNGIPYGGDRGFDVRVGHIKEPLGLDELASTGDRSFLEGPLVNVFAPSRNPGILLSDALLGEPKYERLTWALGAFKDSDSLPSSNDSDEDQGYQITGRVTGLPLYAEGGRRLLHLGISASLRNPDGARLGYAARPETRLSLFRYADPDSALLPEGFRLRDARAEDVLLTGLEAAGVLGPFWFQSEYLRSAVDTTFGGHVAFDGWYAQAGYLLTGEHRPYRHDSGRFGRPKPSRPFAFRGESRGPGAWEIAARYGAVDLSDGPIYGGEHTSLTLGLNWYLNSNFRVTVNYIHNQIDHPLYDGGFDSLQTRFQLDF